MAINTMQSTKVTPGHLCCVVPRLGFRQVQMTCIIFKIGSICTEWNTLFKKIQHFSLLLFNKFDHLLQQNPLRPHLWTWHRKWKRNHWRRSWKHYKRWNVNSKQTQNKLISSNHTEQPRPVTPNDSNLCLLNNKRINRRHSSRATPVEKSKIPKMNK